MADQQDGSKDAALRERAEQKLQESRINAVDFSLDDAKNLIHELHVHQIELELQNEELRGTQLALETSHRKYIDLYEFSPIGLLSVDQNERIQEANLTFVTLLGIDREKLIQRNLSDFIDRSGQDTYHFFYQALHRTQQPQQCEISLLPANKSSLVVRLDGTVVTEAGATISYRIAVSDVTLQKQAEAQRLELTAERQRTRVLANFVRDISHDLRTPITMISTGLYLIGKTTDKEKQLEKMEAVQEQLSYLVRILDQFQQMAAQDSATELALQLGDMNPRVADALHIFRPQADLKHVKLIEQVQRGLPPVYFHAETIDQVLNILLDNALQFTGQEGVITVTTYQENTSIVVEVSDNGIGISADRLPHIFERFFKADESRHLSGGAGLGLAMAKRIIELHHGSIEVSSMFGVKTVFRVKLPLPGPTEITYSAES